MRVGWAGRATFIQTGGTNTVAGGEDGTSLWIADQPGSDGRYELSGGTNTLAGDLWLGEGLGSVGTYELSGKGELYARRAIVGYEGTGTFIQSGGTNTLAQGEDGTSLFVGAETGSDGRYELTDGTLSVGGIAFIGARGTGTFAQTGGTNAVAQGGWGIAVLIGSDAGSDGRYELGGGTLRAAGDVLVGPDGTGLLLISGSSASLEARHLVIATGSGSSSLSIADAGARISVGDLTFGTNAMFTAVPGSTIHITGGSVENYSADETALVGLEDLNLICGGDPTYVEAAGLDGPNPESCMNNFVIDTLTVNGVVVLVDGVDNGNRGGTHGWDEALYVNHLVCAPDAILYTQGLHLYVDCVGPVPPGCRICIGSEKGDFDRDCDVDLADYSKFNACLAGPGVSIPPSCDRADFDGDSDVDLADFAIFQCRFTGEH